MLIVIEDNGMAIWNSSRGCYQYAKVAPAPYLQMAQTKRLTNNKHPVRLNFKRLEVCAANFFLRERERERIPCPLWHFVLCRKELTERQNL